MYICVQRAFAVLNFLLFHLNFLNMFDPILNFVIKFCVNIYAKLVTIFIFTTFSFYPNNSISEKKGSYHHDSWVLYDMRLYVYM